MVEKVVEHPKRRNFRQNVVVIVVVIAVVTVEVILIVADVITT